MGERLEEMICDIRHDFFQCAHVYVNLCSDAKKKNFIYRMH